jgi:hypothetical protein
MVMRPCNLLKIAPVKTVIPSCSFLASKGLYRDSCLRTLHSARQTELLHNGAGKLSLGSKPRFGA